MTINALDRAKATHMDSASYHWDLSIKYVREALNHYDPDVVALVRRIFTVQSMTRFYAFGGFMIGSSNVGYGHRPAYGQRELMEFASDFATYLLAKHCEPGVAYWRHTNNMDKVDEVHIVCGKDHPDAHPFFHNNHELQVLTDPDAERLTAARAVEILDWYENQRADSKTSMLEDMAEGGSFWGQEDLDGFDPTQEDLENVLLIEAFDQITGGSNDK